MRLRPWVAIPFIALASACKPDDSDVFRGRGLTVAPLRAADQASVYAAALRAAFYVDDPGLSLLLDPRLLPRTAGVGDGAPVPAAITRALRDSGASV